MKVVFCVPTITRPFPQFLEALEASVEHLEGWDHKLVAEIGNPYISSARAHLLRKALDIEPDSVVFLDHDMSWSPGDLKKLLEVDAPVVGGTYRFKKHEISYMGTLFTDDGGYPIVREDGLMKAEHLPAGFLRVTADAVERFMRHFPELCFGKRYRPHVDLFNHGAYNHVWYGEDYAFSRNWREIDDLWLLPDVDLTHWALGDAGYISYPGNYRKFLEDRANAGKDGASKARDSGCRITAGGGLSLRKWVDGLSANPFRRFKEEGEAA